MKKTAIILVTYNHYDLTEKCLSDLSFLDKNKFVIAVTDNNSSDNTPEKIELNFPDVFLFPLKENKGFGFANNFAVQKLKEKNIPFDKICFINNDTRLTKETVEILVADLEKYPDFIFSPKVIDRNAKIQINYFQAFSKKQFLLNAFRTKEKAAKYLHGSLNKKRDSFYEVSFFGAVLWVLSLKTFETVGGFDENIFMYNEDFDFSLRAKKHGVLFLIDERSVLTHLGGASAKSSLSQSLEHDNSLHYVLKKHFGFQGFLLSILFRFCRSLFRIMLSVPLFVCKEKREYIKIHFKLLFNIFRKSSENLL